MVKYRKQRKSRLETNGLDEPLLRWLAWLEKTSSPELLEEVVKMDAAIQSAEERMFHVTQSEEDKIAYDRYLIAECDRISAINSALREGHKKGSEKRDQYIIKLIDQGLSTEEIKQRLSQKTKK